MVAGTGASRVLGQVRNLVLIWLIGQTSTAANAFTLANSLPTVLYGLLVSGTLSAVLVPQIVRAYQRGSGQEYVNRVLSLGLVAVAVMTVALTAAVPLVVALYGQGPDRNHLGLTVAFAWWTMPQVFFYGVYALLGQVLNARGSFGPFMWAPVANNVVAIATFAVFAARYGAWQDHPPEPQLWTPGQIAVLAGGATLGIAVQALVLVPALRRAGVDYRFGWRWRGVGLRAAGGAAWWTFLALLVAQVGFVVVSRVAAAAGAQSGPVAGLAVYNNANLLVMLPHSLVTVSLLTALLPRLSAQAADRDHQAAAATLSRSVRAIGLFTIVASAAGVLLAGPLVRAVFPTTTAADAPALTQVVVMFMVGLPALGVWSACQRVYYAYDATRGLVPVTVAMAAVVVLGTLGVRFLLPASQWVAGAALAMSASYLLAAVMALVGLRRRIGPVRGGAILRTYLRATLAVIVAAGIGWVALTGLRAAGLVDRAGWEGWAEAVALCVLVGSVMAGVYLAVLRWLRVRELDVLIASVRRLRGAH